MIIKNPKYELTAVKPEQYPQKNFPEISFVGRSNVGKSSFINALLNRKSLARVSGTPGKTREINFYNIDEIFYLVDLPGYGYAKVSKEKKSTWQGVIETYLTSRKQLRLIVLLVDIRHTPSEEDKLMFEWLYAQQQPFMVVATKEDKVPKAQIEERIKDIKDTFLMDENTKILSFSSKTKVGREEILDIMGLYVLNQ